MEMREQAEARQSVQAEAPASFMASAAALFSVAIEVSAAASPADTRARFAD